MNRRLVGFALIIVSLVAMGIWEFWGREHISYETILVLKEPLKANTVVKEDDFTFKRVEAPSKYALKPEDKASFIGLETAQYVAENVELRREYFIGTEYQVGSNTGKGIMALPLDWFMSYPQTITRGDKVEIYKDDQRIAECIVAHSRDSSNNDVVFSDVDRSNASGTVLYLEVIGEISTLIDISKQASSGTRFTLINLC